MKNDIFIITGIEIYNKGDNSITYKFMFDSGIDFDLISEYDYWGLIKKIDGKWFISSGDSDGFKICGGRNVIKSDKFNNTVYLMKEDQALEFIEEYGDQINYNIFHSKKILFES